ncbi:MAG: hypothetical protein J6P89_05645, partial [Oscillospiraceae bacterium]|nr:hypothetical protein [Oscillospiraceae bacterium]
IVPKAPPFLMNAFGVLLPEKAPFGCLLSKLFFNSPFFNCSTAASGCFFFVENRMKMCYNQIRVFYGNTDQHFPEDKLIIQRQKQKNKGKKDDYV